MARILGITTFLGIPTGLPTWLAAAGAGVVVAAIAVGLPRRRAVAQGASRSVVQPASPRR
jgi:hypothetical protein